MKLAVISAMSCESGAGAIIKNIAVASNRVCFQNVLFSVAPLLYSGKGFALSDNGSNFINQLRTCEAGFCWLEDSRA